MGYTVRSWTFDGTLRQGQWYAPDDRAAAKSWSEHWTRQKDLCGFEMRRAVPGTPLVAAGYRGAPSGEAL